ncbi:PREDICTED: 4-coumarate--CoA ligase 1-like [Papilio polytes]|uniref:4-coumarate--CoA ligase 1-like n=1 Tax=Papilio polytes TaxID=76194 RepID=UPI0006761A7F|nr:PREDICTED: 4-coumarate--CoA ligase 1-like [Papilio polytes]
MFRTQLINKAFKNDYRNFLGVLTKKKHVWTSDNIVKSPFKDIVIPNISVGEHLVQNLEKWATKTAAVCGITGRQYTYEQVYTHSQRLGANLRKKLKIQKGDTIGVILPNMPEYLATLIGSLNAGGVISTMNPNYTAYEIQRQVTMSDTKLIFAVRETIDVVKEALKLCQKNIPIIVINLDGSLPEGTISFKELAEDSHVDVSILKEVKSKGEDISFLPYSSGTTGLPKGVELTHSNIVANLLQQDTECRQYEYTTETYQDSVLVSLPMFHCYGLTVVTLHKFSVGLKLVTVPQFRPETFVNILSNFNLNLFYLSPPTVLFMGSYPQVLPEYLEHLRCITCGAAPLPTADIEKFLSKLKPTAHFAQAYGLTETSPLATANPIGYKDYSKVGFALPSSSLRIIDGNNNNLGPDEIGELVMKGPNIMKGYKNNPEANKQVFLEDGWLRTGDLAKVDEFGAVTIADRLKELIKVNAYQVPPAELESLCKEHPAVFDAAVVPVPDEKTGEKPKAFIVVKSSAKVNEEDIMAFVAERVAPYKRLKEVKFIDEIPKNPSGKILRRVLVEKFC